MIAALIAGPFPAEWTPALLGTCAEPELQDGAQRGEPDSCRQPQHPKTKSPGQLSSERIGVPAGADQGLSHHTRVLRVVGDHTTPEKKRCRSGGPRSLPARRRDRPSYGRPMESPMAVPRIEPTMGASATDIRGQAPAPEAPGKFLSPAGSAASGLSRPSARRSRS